MMSLEHNAWATREVLRACEKLTDEAWHRRFEIGPGSLHDTITHIVGAMFRWADRIDGPPRVVRPSIEDGSWRTPAELRARRCAIEVATHAQCLREVPRQSDVIGVPFRARSDQHPALE